MKKLNELIKLPEVKTIFNLFNNNQGIYLVGGCIRDALSGKDVTDIDFAVDIDPEEVIKILTNNNIKFYDIGINYGTVTAVIDSKNYESLKSFDINLNSHIINHSFSIDLLSMN